MRNELRELFFKQHSYRMVGYENKMKEIFADEANVLQYKSCKLIECGAVSNDFSERNGQFDLQLQAE